MHGIHGIKKEKQVWNLLGRKLYTFEKVCKVLCHILVGHNPLIWACVSV
jgi:hypothetical protein